MAPTSLWAFVCLSLQPSHLASWLHCLNDIINCCLLLINRTKSNWTWGGHLFNYGVRENIISPVLEDPIQKNCSFSMHSVFCFFSFLAESLDLWEQSNRQRYELLEKTSHCKLYVVAMNNEETMNSRSGVFLCLIQVLDRLKMNKNKNRTWYDVWCFILFERNNSTGDNYCFLMCHNWNFGTEL